MKADETRLATLLKGRKQYVVPYFQRAYSWRRQQWNTLFDDILEMYELHSSHSHFLGSMVLLAETKPYEDGFRPNLLIDGQQRLVTLSLFLAAVRDMVRDSHPQLSERIERDYLLNQGVSGDEQLKVVATHEDRAVFKTVILGSAEPPHSSVTEAYRHFRSALREQSDKGVELDRLVQIVVQQLSFVAITLDSEDNPYRIFESLNAKGMPLTQGDLLRNYFFMRLPPADHERLYASLWAPMQRRLGERFDEYMRDFLIKDGASVKPDEVYQEWRKRLGPLEQDEIALVLQDLADWSLEYDQILHPQREADADLRKRLERLLVWSGTVPQSFKPLLMRLHADFRRGHLSADQLREIFGAIESFVVRRLFTQAPAIDENQVLIGLYNDASRQADRAAAFLEALSRPQLGWPGDKEFAEAIVRFPLYFASHPDQRKLIMEALEDSYPHRAPLRYDQLDLQLITPLLPREDWLEELGVSEAGYWKVIGALGNFTWVPRGTMPDLNVAGRKKELLRMTRYGLELVRDFAQVPRWTAAEIEHRSRRLAARALPLWPGPQR